MNGISRDALAAMTATGRTVVVLDVRSPEEFGQGTVDGALNVPADLVADAQLPPGATVVTVCNHGGSRSRGAAEILRARGIDATYLLGGVKGPKAGH